MISKWIIKDLNDKLVPILKKSTHKKLLLIIKRIVYKNKPKKRTITWRYSMIKKYLKDKKIITDEELLNKIKPKDNLTLEVIKKNQVIRDSKKRLIINKELIQKLLKYGDSNNIYDMYIYLLFISGRRLSEMVNSKFINRKGNKNIIVKKLLKTNDKDNNKEYEFPTLVSKTKFFKIYKKFILKYKHSNIKNIQGNLQRIVKNKIDDKFKLHNLRGIYVIYLYTFRNKENLKINTFIQKTLNHNSIDSSISYTGNHIDFKNDIIQKKKKNNKEIK